jgi:hypothetical protein
MQVFRLVAQTYLGIVTKALLSIISGYELAIERSVTGVHFTSATLGLTVNNDKQTQ